MNKLIIILSLSVCSLFAQNANSLIMVMSSNSMLERPEEFRKIQISINEEIHDVQYGFRVDIIQEKLSKFKKQITDGLNILEFKVEYNKTNKKLNASLKYPDFNSDSPIIKTETISLGNKTSIESLIDNLSESKVKPLKEKLEKHFNTYLDSILKHNVKTTEMRKAILFSITETLSGLGYVKEDISNNGNLEKMIKNISDAIISKIFDMVCNFALEILNKMKVEAPKILTDSDLVLVNNKINESIKKPISKLSNILDETEFLITQQVSTLNRFLISGNMGVALTDGNGDVAGGIHLSFKWTPHFSIGAYFNGNFESKQVDEINTGSTLIGFQAKFTPYKYLEFDILGSKSSRKGVSDSYEMGGGASFNCYNFILGIAYFHSNYTVNEKKASNHTIGFRLNSIRANSPGIFLGLILDKERKGKPILQVSYPISAK